MAETTYVEVVWTAGDIITEAKMDNMGANDKAVDAMAQGVELVERASPSTPATNKIHVYGKDKSGVSTLYAINDAGTDFEISERHSTFVFTYPDALVADTNVCPVLVATRALTIEKVYANVKTAPTGANLVIDINKNATTIWSTQANRLTILAAALSGTQDAFNVTSLVEGDILTIDLDTVGSTIAGESLTVEVKCK
jgi:hypothetical protein